MATIFETVSELWKAAMRDRDPAKDVYSAIRTEIKNRVIANRTGGSGEMAPDDSNSLEALKKMAKQRKESIQEYAKANRADLVDKEGFELRIIEGFLPQQLSAEELAELVGSVFSGIEDVGRKNMGLVMKAVMPKVAGRAEGKDVQTAVKKAMGL